MPGSSNPVAEAVFARLTEADFGPYFGTPCGVLAPLYQLLEHSARLTTVGREDNAVGLAAGAALAGKQPAVLMQNSGFGQSVNAVASLVVPYRIPMLLIISMRGVAPDRTEENIGMGVLTRLILDRLGIPVWAVDDDPASSDAVAKADVTMRQESRPVALLVAPDAFGWRP